MKLKPSDIYEIARRQFHGETITEIAKSLGVTPSAISTMKSRHQEKYDGILSTLHQKRNDENTKSDLVELVRINRDNLPCYEIIGRIAQQLSLSFLEAKLLYISQKAKTADIPEIAEYVYHEQKRKGATGQEIQFVLTSLLNITEGQAKNFVSKLQTGRK